MTTGTMASPLAMRPICRAETPQEVPWFCLAHASFLMAYLN